MNIQKFLKGRGLAFYLQAASALLMILSLIFLLVTATTNKDLEAQMVLLTIFGIVLEIATLFIDFFGIGELAATVLFICGPLLLVDRRLTMIGLILNGVVSEKIPAAFTLMWIVGLLAVILNCVVAFLGEKPASVKNAEEVKA
jgi:hypothetical protein